jgi:hypothetical protein
MDLVLHALQNLVPIQLRAVAAAQVFDSHGKMTLVICHQLDLQVVARNGGILL